VTVDEFVDGGLPGVIRAELLEQATQIASAQDEVVARTTGKLVVARAAGNKIIAEAIMTARASIREGETVSAPLKASGVFPPMVVQMITVGEQTGALDEMLTKIAVFYEAEVDTAVDTLTSIIEPIMIVVMVGIVGGMVVAMYLPMFKLISVVAGGGH